MLLPPAAMAANRLTDRGREDGTERMLFLLKILLLLVVPEGWVAAMGLLPPAASPDRREPKGLRKRGGGRRAEWSRRKARRWGLVTAAPCGGCCSYSTCRRRSVRNAGGAAAPASPRRGWTRVGVASVGMGGGRYRRSKRGGERRVRMLRKAGAEAFEPRIPNHLA